MAMFIDNHDNNSSSNGYRKSSSESSKRSNTQASAYVVDAATMGLTGFHFTTSGAGGGGAFEDGLDSLSPPSSPASRPVLKTRRRSGGAAYHITEECERLFCETLRAVFLVEKDDSLENSLVTDTRNTKTNINARQIPPKQQPTLPKHDLPTPSPSPDGRIYPKTGGLIKDYVEVWDYSAGACFRGFVAEKEDQRSLFVFFDQAVIGMDLKPGLMALLELAGSDGLECGQLVICADRTADREDFEDVIRNLGWVGFEAIMLDVWAGREKRCISDRWMFLGMDV